MQQKLDKFMQDSLKQINNRPRELEKNLLDLSYLAAAAATFNTKDQYHLYISKMDTIFKDPLLVKQIDKGWQIWMLGRMAIAAKLAGDSDTLQETVARLQGQIKHYGGKNVFTGWAVNYLAAVSPEFYKHYRESLIEFIQLALTNHQQKPGDIYCRNLYIWMLVSAIHAASGRNAKDYLAFLTELKAALPNQSLKECISLLPPEHLGRAMVSQLRYSFARMGDAVHLAELPLIRIEEITNFDAFMSVVTEMNTQALLAARKNKSTSQNPNSFHHQTASPIAIASQSVEQNPEPKIGNPGAK